MKVVLERCGAEVEFVMPKMNAYERIIQCTKQFEIKKYAKDLISSIKLKDGFEVEKEKYTQWIDGLDADDGLVVYSYFNVIIGEAQLLIEKSGAKKAIADLQEKLKSTQEVEKSEV